MQGFYEKSNKFLLVINAKFSKKQEIYFKLSPKFNSKIGTQVKEESAIPKFKNDFDYGRISMISNSLLT